MLEHSLRAIGTHLRTGTTHAVLLLAAWFLAATPQSSAEVTQQCPEGNGGQLRSVGIELQRLPPVACDALPTASCSPVFSARYEEEVSLAPLFPAVSPQAAVSDTDWRPLELFGDSGSCYRIDGWVRGYYLNDQRIEWSGQESTFGAEGGIAPVFRHQFDKLEMTVQGEFYINQPFNRNILVDTAERRSYAGNFDVDTFEISQLYIELQCGDWSLTAGKMVTPFGRTYFPLYSNSRLDAPFIRTEVIHWRETGLSARYCPGQFCWRRGHNKWLRRLRYQLLEGLGHSPGPSISIVGGRNLAEDPRRYRLRGAKGVQQPSRRRPDDPHCQFHDFRRGGV